MTFSKNENSTKSLKLMNKKYPDTYLNNSLKSTPVKKEHAKNFSTRGIYSEGKNPLSPLKTSQDNNTYKNYKTNYSSYNSNTIGRINSLRPFEKFDHEFYIEKTECSLWGKESSIIKAEKKIFSEKKLSNQNVSNFGGVNVVSHIIKSVLNSFSFSHVYFPTNKLTRTRNIISILILR